MAENALPLIGLTTYQRPVEFGGRQVSFYGLTASYVRAVQAAGGLPMLIPHRVPERELKALIGRLDGLILPGGEDLDPVEYGAVQIPACGRIDRERDSLELTVARYAIEEKLPLLAICRGHQVLNVALGGTLWQDLASQLPDSQPHACRDLEDQNVIAHTVRITSDSHLYSILGVETIGTNSSHHQAIRDLAAGLVATAWAPDDVIEAVELPGHPFAIGLQWHPERMVTMHPRMMRPFEALVEAARG